MIEDEYFGHDTDVLVEQFAAIRETGATNMLDKRGVQKVAEEAGAHELVEFIEKSSSPEYVAVLEEMGERRTS